MTLFWTVLVSLIIIFLSVSLVKLKNKFHSLTKFTNVTFPLSECFRFVRSVFFGSDYIVRKYTSKKMLTSLYHRYKEHDSFVVWVLGYPILVSGDLNHVELINRNSTQRSFVLNFGKPYFREGLTISNGSKWKKSRKMIEPSFATKVLAGFVPTMQYHSELLVKKIGNTQNGWIEINDLINRTTFNIILETAMGVSTETDTQDKEVESVLKTIELGADFMIQRACNPLLWSEIIVSIYLRIFYSSINPGAMNALFRKIILKAIERQKQKMEEENVSKDSQIRKREIFVDHLARIYVDGLNNNEVSITIEDIEDEVNNFVLAGFDTITTGLFWTLTCIGNDQLIQGRICAEISDVLGTETFFDVENLSKLVYVEQCVKEALRLMPPIPISPKHANKDFMLDDKLIPKGTEIITLIWNIHRDPNIYPNPETYNPERFSPENRHNIPSAAFIPFGSGPRVCIGNKFAIIEMKILLATIVKNFKVICEKSVQDIDWYLPLSLKSQQQIKFKFIARNKNYFCKI